MNDLIEQFTNATYSLVSAAAEAGKIALFAFPPTVAAAYLVALAVRAFSKKRRKASGAAAPLAAALLSAWLSFALALRERPGFISFGLFGFAACFVCSAFAALFPQKKQLSVKDKRLIGALLEKTEDPDDLSRRDFDAPPRRAERLFPQGEFPAPETEPNPGAVKAMIARLRKEPLTVDEADELDKAEMDAERFALRPPMPHERMAFSDRLLRIIKMTSKYGSEQK